MKRVSLDKIAKEVGLSKTTVSMVLNGKGDQYKINKDTQKQILDVAKKNRFRPNQIARNLSKGNSMTLGLIVPSMIDIHYGHIAEHIEQISSKLGYQVLLGATHEDPKKEKELLLTFEAQQVDGILIASTQHNLQDIKAISDSGLPVVLFDRHYPEADLPYVVVDNYGGTRKLVDYLISCNRKNIGYVGVNLDLTAILDRQNGFVDTVKKRNVPKSAVKIVDYENARHECPKAVEELLLEQKVDGIAFETHYMALYGIGKINEMGLNDPEHISFVSFGDHDVFSIFRPEVSALIQPAQQMAQSSMDILMMLIEGKSASSSKLFRVEEPHLETRST